MGYSNSVEETERRLLDYSQHSEYRKEAISLSWNFFDGYVLSADPTIAKEVTAKNIKFYEVPESFDSTKETWRLLMNLFLKE